MKNKGYTIMEAVVAMFLVLVMVGAVFSALMSGRRAITSSTEREEVFYSLQSAYTMLKDCRGNNDCDLKNILNCNNILFETGSFDLKNCRELFSSNFQSICKSATNGNNKFEFTIKDANSDNVPGGLFYSLNNGVEEVGLNNFYVLNMTAHCKE